MSPSSVPVKSHRHSWGDAFRTLESESVDGMEMRSPIHVVVCRICGKDRDPVRSRRGATVRSYGTRAELKVARTYGGEKIGHHGGPVDVQGAEWETQVKTHRRPPPAEWVKAFAALPGDRLPRLLLRFVRPGQPPVDYFVVPGAAWLDWHGRDE